MRRRNQSASIRRLVSSLIADENKTLPVITYLVRLEWDQRLGEVQRKAKEHLEKLDRQIARTLVTCENAEIALTGPSTHFATSPLIQGLTELAERLIDRAIVLEKEDGCIERALDRVMGKRRPAHNDKIKDSIHLEHYLEFSRRLGQAGFTERRLFVSANEVDFGIGQGRPHPDLKDEFTAAGLQYFGKLEAALGQLGI